jgi:ABC-type transporter MlaC component
MQRILTYLIIGMLVLSASSAMADEAASTEAQKTIQSQIEAFRAGDDARAYSYAAPTIQSYFPTVESFMAMVKGGYSPVWQPQHFQFGKSREVGNGQVAQEVEVIAKDGSSWVALYSLMRMADGSWKITGVQLLKGDGGSA